MNIDSRYKLREFHWSSLSKWHYIIFFIWPFGGLLYALKNIKQKQTSLLMLFFSFFFGLTFVIGGESGTSDSARYADKLETIHNNSNSILEVIKSSYVEGGSLDLYQPLITGLVALFTGDARFLYAIFGLVFGFFLIKNLFILIKEIKYNFNYILVILLVSFFLINPIWNINGVRMWTAAQVFLLGLLQIFIQKNKQGYFWIFSSIFFHFSFLLPVFIFLSYRLIPKKINILFYIFIVSAFFSEVEISFFRNAFNYLPGIFQDRVNLYVGEAYVEKVSENKQSFAIHVVLAIILFKYVTYLLLLLMFLNRKRYIKTVPYFKNLFAFSLYFGIFAQLVSNIPSGSRFIVIQQMLFYTLFIVSIYNFNFLKKIKLLYLFIVIGLSFSLLFKLRMGLDYMSFFTLLGNPIIALAIDEQVTPIIETIKSIF